LRGKFYTSFNTNRTTNTGQKNMSKDYVVKHIEIDIDDLKVSRNNLGGSFSTSKKERTYLLTNSSTIMNLTSYKTLDLPDKNECREFETTKGNQNLKRSVN
jgi:hypothetical protein